MPRTSLAPCAFALALSASSAMVSAQTRVPRISVGTFSGQRVEFARSVVASALSEHAGEVEFVAASEYASAAARAGMTGSSSDEAVTRVSQSLRLDEVIVGNLDRRGDSWRLQLRVLRGRDAHVEGTVTWEMNRVDELTALRGDVWEQLVPYLHLDPQRAGGSTPRPDNGQPVGVITAPEENTNHPVGTEIARTPGLGWLSLSAGGGLAGRSWRVPVLGEATPRGYENGAYGEMALGLSLLYRFNQQRFGLGGEGRIAFPIGLSSQGRDAAGRLVPLATSAFELLLGAVLVRRPSFGGMFRLHAGVVVHAFTLDTERLAPEMRLARMSYVGFRVAGEGQLPFVANQGWEFGALFGGELRAVGVGAEARQAFGLQPGSTLGLGSWFGLYGRLDQAAPGLGVRLLAEFVRYRTAFAGSASIGTVSDSVDDYTRFTLALTYTLGTSRSTAPSSASTTTAPSDGASGESTTRAADPFTSR